MMMEPSTSLSEDSALAEALTKLEVLEKENARLRFTTGNKSSSSGTSSRKESNQELLRLQHQIEELMQVNHQWDLEYREQDDNFRRYRIDSQQAQADSQGVITRLKEEKEGMMEKLHATEAHYKHCERQNMELMAKIATLQEELKHFGGRAMVGSAGVPQPMVSHKKVRELEEECQLLRQQLKTYQDDFVEERKDRQRMNDEKQCAAVKHEAEVTSLRLQLERCKAELAHYTAEANRLSQQLRMKNHQDEEQYKKHLESKGYITRSPSGHLPPMDPFVEIDDEKLPRRSTSVPSPSHSPRLLTRGVDLIQAYSSSQGTHSSSNGMSHSAMDSDRSRSPIMPNTETNGVRYLGLDYNPQPARVPSPPSPHRPSSSSSNYSSTYNTTRGSSTSDAGVTNYPAPLTNGTTMPRASNMDDRHHVQYNGGIGNGPTTNGHQNLVGMSNGVANMRYTDRSGDSYGNNGIAAIPPMETKGRYTCPRCARKFKSKGDCEEHKARCLA